MEQGDIVKARCNVCAGERKHFVVHYHETKWTEEISDDPPAGIYGEDRYELLQCAGCDAVMLRHTSIHSEQTDEEGNIRPAVTYYPPPTFRQPPRWLHAITVGGGDTFAIIWMPEFISRLIREIYTALHGECLRLAAMGVRALLESVIIDCVSDLDSFHTNLAAFQKEGYISPHQKAILEATLELGHASIHRGYAPAREDIMETLDITENLIQTIYVSHEQASALRKKIPARRKKA
jgi:Domain of unknown function (DUF4145)